MVMMAIMITFNSLIFVQIIFKCSSEQEALRHQYKVYHYFSFLVFYSFFLLSSETLCSSGTTSQMTDF